MTFIPSEDPASEEHYNECVKFETKVNTELLDMLADVSLGRFKKEDIDNIWTDSSLKKEKSIMPEKTEIKPKQPPVASYTRQLYPLNPPLPSIDTGRRKRQVCTPGGSLVLPVGVRVQTNLDVESPRKKTKGPADRGTPEGRKSQSRTNFSEGTKAAWRKWAQENDDHPYPDDKAMSELATMTGTGKQQVRDWFRNYRKREWWKSKNNSGASTPV